MTEDDRILQEPQETGEPETGPFDQTRFAEESVILPTADLSQKPVATAPKKRSPLVFLIGGLVVFSLLAMVFVLMLSRGRNGVGGPLIPTPSPEASPEMQSELQRRFQELAKDIDAADPGKGALAFPPIDFSLDLQDATALRQRQRR